MKRWLINGRIFDGERILHGHSVLLEGDQIAAVGADQGRIIGGAAPIDLQGGLLAPGFIDVQVNGGGGVLFNDQPSLGGLRTIAATHRRFGTTGLMPTLISAADMVMADAITTVNAAVKQVPGVLGLHLEGPWLNPARRGIHPAAALRRPGSQAMRLLTRLKSPARLIVTLAPEQVPAGFIHSLAEAGIIVCAGHSAAGYTQMVAAVDEGLRGYTHLFNAMSPMHSREPGVVGAALEDPRGWCGIIVDGHHVHPATLRVALAAKRRGRMMLVSDAIHTTGAEGERFELLGTPITRREQRLSSEDGTLAGAELSMDQAVRNTVTMLGQPLEEALRMASLYPAKFLRLDQRLGRIAPGYRADLVLLDEQLAVRNTWVGGVAAGETAGEQ